MFYFCSMIKEILLGLLFLGISFVAIAQDVEEDPTLMFQVANKAYMDGKYTEAITSYEKLVALQMVSGDLYYNLGSSYLQTKKIGQAILNLERALIHSPGSPDIEHNLSLAKLQLKDDINEIPLFFLTRWWRNLALLASANLWGILGLLLLSLGSAGLIVWQLGRMRSLRKRGFLGGSILLILGIIPILLSFTRINLEKNSPFAIIQASKTTLYSAPDNSSQSIFDLHEGTKVEIVDKIEEWYKVRLLNGDQGWLPGDIMERI